MENVEALIGIKNEHLLFLYRKTTNYNEMDFIAWQTQKFAKKNNFSEK